jgi:hypothetical protein
LPHDGAHPPIDGPDHEHVPARVAAPPDADPGGVDLVERGGVGDGMAVVAHLQTSPLVAEDCTYCKIAADDYVTR